MLQALVYGLWHVEANTRMMLHKATHHFDLVNWWLNTRPETVVAIGRAADHVSGALSILTGIAANQSFATRLPVRVPDLVRL